LNETNAVELPGMFSVSSIASLDQLSALIGVTTFCGTPKRRKFRRVL